MGFLSFLKKKEQKQSDELDLRSLNTDLPRIDGSALGSDLSLPSLDLPPMDELPPLNPRQENINSLTQSQMQSQSFGSQPQHEQLVVPDDLSTEINQLFLSDSEWKEPDWNTYMPYSEEPIEQPSLEDFGITPPQPMYVAPISKESPVQSKFEIPEFQDIEEHHIPENLPYDVFVKGTDYKRVSQEMDEIKKILQDQDQKMSQVMDTFKHEESTINTCKDNMDAMYKRLLLIDKKVFT